MKFLIAEHTIFLGVMTLLKKELLRFWRVGFQTVLAPMMTALLYFMVFSHVLGGSVSISGVSYDTFLAVGLISMSMLQNAFANSSSSIIQSKAMGNLIFVLITPISAFGFFIAFLSAAILRGLCVGLSIYLVTWFFVDLSILHIWTVLLFSVLGCGLLGTLGIIAGIWAEKFDQLAVFQNFIIMPLSFLSGVFYSIQSLSPFWQKISHLNPFFYMIDGFRYGFLGINDASVGLSLLLTTVSFLALSLLTIYLLKIGYKLKN